MSFLAALPVRLLSCGSLQAFQSINHSSARSCRGAKNSLAPTKSTLLAHGLSQYWEETHCLPQVGCYASEEWDRDGTDPKVS